MFSYDILLRNQSSLYLPLFACERIPKPDTPETYCELQSGLYTNTPFWLPQGSSGQHEEQSLGYTNYHRELPWWCSGKEPTCQCRRHKRLRFNPGSGSPPRGGNGNSFQYSCLENPMDKGAWQATVHGVTKFRHNNSKLSQGVFLTFCN